MLFMSLKILHKHAIIVFSPIFNKFSNLDNMNNSGRCKTKAF
jgi:hypothetical protein